MAESDVLMNLNGWRSLRGADQNAADNGHQARNGGDQDGSKRLDNQGDSVGPE